MKYVLLLMGCLRAEPGHLRGCHIVGAERVADERECRRLAARVLPRLAIPQGQSLLITCTPLRGKAPPADYKGR